MLRQFLRTGQKQVARNQRHSKTLTALLAPNSHQVLESRVKWLTLAQQARYFSSSNREETFNSDQKSGMKGTVAAEIPLSGILQWVLRFADKDPKDGENKKGKNDEKQDDFDPKKFFKDNKDKAGYAILALIAVALFFGENIRESMGMYPKISFQELSDLINQNQVKKIKVQKVVDEMDFRFQALVYTLDGKYIIHIGNVDSFTENIERLQTGYSQTTQSETGMTTSSSSISGGENLIPIEFENTRAPIRYFSKAVSIGSSLAVIAFFLYMLKASKNVDLSAQGLNGTQNFMKSNAKKFSVESNIKTKFADVAGLGQAKLEITEFVDFLKFPDKYKKLGAKIPRGALLSGPPGTGKTLLAKACAGEAGVNFFYTSGSEFVEMFVGVGASRVRDLFKEAKANSPAIIFIDEIDAIGKKRDNSVGSGSDERDSTLNQLLVELDGFSTDTEVVVFAATNRKELLDSALIRTGRFDRSIEVGLPDLEGRKEIFNVHLKPLKLSDEKTIENHAKRLATLTPGFSGADISNICNEAAILAARNNRESVTPYDFEMAVERVIGGLEMKRIVSIEEKTTVAVHESGHAVVSWFLEGGDPLLKLTIIPRSKGSLGFAQYLPNETSLDTKEALLDKICKILGGRVAEEEFFQKVTTGAYDDLNKAYQMARTIVTKVGMSEKIGYVNFSENEYGMKTYSDATNKLIDDEVKRIIDECTQRTRVLVKEKRELIKNLSDLLLEKETIDLKQIVSVLGERPFAAKENYKAYLEELKLDEQEAKAKEQAAAKI